MPPIDYHGLSETGPSRDDNQDNLWLPGDSYPSPGSLFILADGMGGYARGEIASEVAIRELFRTVAASLPEGGLNGSASGVLRKGITAANTAVLNTAARMNITRMGTTLLAAWITSGRLHLAHVGDSRAYLVRKDPGGTWKASCLTNDHSLVGDLVRAKVIAPEQVRGHARRSHLTRAVGMDLFVQPELVNIPLQPGDRLILCTDGLWAVVEDEAIADLTQTCERMDQLCRLLVDLAYQNGSDDNASVIAVHVIEIDSSPPSDPASRRKGWLGRLMNTRGKGGGLKGFL
jgi:PPM family protein phosphatase